MMVLGFVVLHAYLRSAGIDTFGPVHYMEVMLPIVLLSGLGVARLTNGLHKMGSTPFVGRLPTGLCFGLIAAALFGYVPARAYALYEVSDVLRRPAVAAEQVDAPAIVFADRPLVPRQCTKNRHFVFAHEVNDPDFENSILWVNHLTIAHDRRLMEHYPDRQALVMRWLSGCRPFFVPLEDAEQWKITDGNTGGSTPIPSPEEMH
ncbi:MAG: hypothetical protein HKN10_09735 [Myxococcales bacterium]|nr:hypothetical protein [Myxococcales bacterium]